MQTEDLSPAIDQLVHEQLSTGKYHSREDVLLWALRNLAEHDQFMADLKAAAEDEKLECAVDVAGDGVRRVRRESREAHPPERKRREDQPPNERPLDELPSLAPDAGFAHGREENATRQPRRVFAQWWLGRGIHLVASCF